MESIIALVPSAGVLLLFALVMRYLFRADRIERENMARLDRENPGTEALDATGVPSVHRGEEQR